MTFTSIDKHPAAPKIPRRTGILTTCCPICYEFNGIQIGLQSSSAMAIYRCHKCETVIRVELQSILVSIYNYSFIQTGVKIHGK